MVQPLVDLAKYDLSKVVIPKSEILKVLPHRYEFEQVDGVVAIDVPNRVIIGMREPKATEFWVRGHVPGMPLFPGVLMIEGAAQLCVILYKRVVPAVENRFIAFAGLDEVRFRGTVKAGEKIFVVGKGIEATDRLCRCGFQGIAGGRIVFEGVVIGMPLRGA